MACCPEVMAQICFQKILLQTIIRAKNTMKVLHTPLKNSISRISIL